MNGLAASSFPSVDVAVVGGGICGLSTALSLAERGMSVAVIDRQGLGSGASGVNAGSLCIQVKRVSLIGYALKALEMWKTLGRKLDYDLHFRMVGGLQLAFNEAEEDLLVRMTEQRRAAGLRINLLSARETLAVEPRLIADIRMSGHCPVDAMTSSNVVGRAFHRALARLGTQISDWDPVERVEPTGAGYEVVTRKGGFRCRRLVVATGAWSKALLAQMGLDVSLSWRTNQMAVTERSGPLVNGLVGHISGLMSVKQAANGTLIIGGGWEGEGVPGEPGCVRDDNLVNNLRFARHAVPEIGNLRLVRTWYGYDALTPDFMPLVGAIPGLEDAFMIVGIRGGYTIGLYMGHLLAEHISGRQPEMPLFDPAPYISAAVPAP